MNSLINQSSEFIKRYEERRCLKKKIIVNAGLLKAGKSSLLNALTGKRQFATDVIRATVKNQKEETDKYILLDTPGLDARNEDTNAALEGYVDADVILFVHNIQEGELSQTEVDSIWQIIDLFGEPLHFFKNSILVLTHKDQEEEHQEETKAKIEKQCKDIFDMTFARVCCVNSVSYMKGIEEKKKLLIQDSGIEELKVALRKIADSSCGLWRGNVYCEQQKLIQKINGEIRKLEKGIPPTDNRESLLKNVKSKIKDIEYQACNKISQEKISVSRSGSYRYIGWAQNYKEYTSKSSARSAGREAIAKTIDETRSKVRSDGLNYVEKIEKYILPSGKMTEYRKYLMGSYETIRQIAEKEGVMIKTPFQINLKDFREQKKYALEAARDNVRYPSFSSAERYADRYECNLEIDEREDTEWVSGLFGSDFGAHFRTVTKHSYNVRGALDDVANDAADIIDDSIDKAVSAVYPIFYEIQDDLCDQFRQIVDKINCEIDETIRSAHNEAIARQQRASQIKKKVDELQNVYRKLEKLKIGESA